MIASIQNPRIRAARKLSGRKERHTAGQVLVEGVRLIGDAWASGMRPLTIFYHPKLIAGNAGAEQLLGALEAGGVECLACAPAVFASLVETVTPQGIAAVLPLPQLVLPDVLRLVLVLDEVRDPGNAGTLLRSAAAAGADLAIFGPNTVDPFNDKVMRAGMGAHFRLPIRTCATWEQIVDLLGSQIRYYLADMWGTLAYDQVDWHLPSVLVVGGETSGASAAARQATTPIAIPMHGTVESLNAAIAGAVILFEAARQRRQDLT